MDQKEEKDKRNDIDEVEVNEVLDTYNPIGINHWEWKIIVSRKRWIVEKGDCVKKIEDRESDTEMVNL